MISARAERNDDDGGYKRADLFSKTPAHRQFGNQPHYGDHDTDERQISVTIGMSLPSNLYDSNYRHQHANKPKPAREQKWESSSVDDRNRRQRDQERGRKQRDQIARERFPSSVTGPRQQGEREE